MEKLVKLKGYPLKMKSKIKMQNKWRHGLEIILPKFCIL